MDRRELVKSILLAGILPATGIAKENESSISPKTELKSYRPIVVDGLSAGSIRQTYLDGMKKGKVDCVVASGPSDFKSFAYLLDFFDQHSEILVHAKSVQDIRRAKSEGKHSNVFGWQAANTLEDGINNPLGSSKTALRGFQEIGLRILGICYNVSNYFGGGNLEPHVGLTRAGYRLVEEVHSLGILLDIGGHTGEQTSLDAIEIAPEIPVICTHTNIAGITDNARCISDRLLDAIASTGGVVGISAVSDFHVRARGEEGQVRRASLDDHVDQYEYVKRRVGVEHVGMGTDFVHGMNISYDQVNKKIIPPDMLREPWVYVENFETIDQVPNLVAAFKRRGWTQKDIDLVMGENWLRVYEKVWGQ